MKALIQFRHFPRLSRLLIILLGAYLGLCPLLRAVVPAPDGGYPGGNTAEGQNALFSLTTGGFNTAVGYFSLRSNTEGQFNTAIGAGALLANVGDQTGHGTENTAIGAGALLSNTTGLNNTANGAFALFANTTGSGNTASGVAALQRNTSGLGNIAIGQAALNENTTGSLNTALGSGALLVAVGSSNTAVGAGAGQNVANANNVICIGQGILGVDVSDSCYIGNIWNQPGGSQAVYVNSDGKLGALVSSRRFKDEIKPIGQASEIIYGLKPVSFRYKKVIEPNRQLGFGLIAEEVEKVNSDLVVHDKEGKPYSVRYDQVNAMLLNEFLKEHKKVEEQDRKAQEQQATIAQLKSTVAQQQKAMEAVIARLKEQDQKMQKVREQLELSHAMTQTAQNNH